MGSEKLPTGLVTLLFTDIVGSVALKQQLGDRRGAHLVEAHHQLVRETLREAEAGKEIETAGDSFLIMFAAPSEAVTFALRLQGRLRELNRGQAVPVLDRLGLHLGEVVIREHAAGLKPRDLYGSNVDTCARVMSLAKGGQVLMSRGVFDSARQVLKGEDLGGVGSLEWLNHGPYLLKGLDEPVEICEVRETGLEQAPGPPTTSEKAQRQVRPDEEPVLGWRPAVGQIIPNTRWVLEKKLGEGGFGEVWLGRNSTTKQARVFKFCFQAERVRFLKREMTLFRVLKERVGDHPNIVRLNDVYLDQPPFYVEMEYVEGNDLRSWCEDQGGVAAIPIETRLEVITQAADGLQAAHEAGIIHRDIKPANILVQRSSRREAAVTMPTGTVEKKENEPPHVGGYGVLVKLTGFGIGQVVSEDYLKGITRAGFTQTILSDSASSQTGTQLYMAPELLAGKPASTRSDIYSLGVVLYQLLVGDFTRPVTTDWAKDIEDRLLREDLQHCFAGQPEDRYVGAGQLAKSLRALPERRAELARREAETVALERAAYRRGMMRTASVAAVIVLLIAGLAVVALNQSGRAKAAAKAESRERAAAQRNLYAAKMNLAQQAWERTDVGRVKQLLEETATNSERGFEWYYWQRQTHRELFTLKGHGASVQAVAFSPDGQRLVTGSWDQAGKVSGTAKVWEAATGKELLTYRGYGGGIFSLAFSPDGRRIATSGWDSTVKVWEAATGKELLTIKAHRAQAWAVAFSPNGQQIVTGGDHAKVWDATTGRELLTLTNEGGVASVAFSRDGQRIITGCWDGTAKVWNAVLGKELLTLKGHTDTVRSAAISPDGRRIATGSYDHTAKVWDAVSGQDLLTLKGHSGKVSVVAFSPDNRRLATGSYDNTVKVWAAVSGQDLFTLKGHTNGIGTAAVAFSPDGGRIATGSFDNTVKVWDANRGDEPILRGGDRISSVAFSPDGQRIATGSYDQTVKIWEVRSGNGVLTLRGHGAPIRAVAFSRDGQRMATGGGDGTAKVWAVSNGKLMATLHGHGNWVNSVAFSPDGQRIVTSSHDQTAKVWEAATGRELFTLSGHSNAVASASFSPDGRWIATGSADGTGKLWDAATGRERLTLKGHSDWVNSVAFSPDAQRIVTGSYDQTAKVWDTVSGKELVNLTGHGDWVTSVAFSHDGQRIVTGSHDWSGKVWEAVSGKELVSLNGHSDRVMSVAFSPDDQRIVTGSWDGTARVWEAATAHQTADWRRDEQAADERVRRDLAATAEQERALPAQNPGAIKQWLVLVPLPNEVPTWEQALEREQIPQEANLRPRAGERVKAGQNERVWRAVQLRDYLVNFDELLGEQTTNSVAYAVCYILSETDQTGIQLKVGADSQCKVYLNGREIYRDHQNWPYVPDQHVVAGVSLRAGVNVLVFKVVGGVRWLASVRFTDAADQPVKGIRVTLNPETKE